jgi:hypothetical protein
MYLLVFCVAVHPAYELCVGEPVLSENSRIDRRWLKARALSLSPRISAESANAHVAIKAAAAIVARHLRERLTICPGLSRA